MTADGIKITWVSADESLDLRERPGFVHPCQYGRSVPMEPNEAGAIVKVTGKPTLDPSGLWVTPCEYVERFLIRETA